MVKNLVNACVYFGRGVVDTKERACQGSKQKTTTKKQAATATHPLPGAASIRRSRRGGALQACRARGNPLAAGCPPPECGGGPRRQPQPSPAPSAPGQLCEIQIPSQDIF